MGRYSNQNDRSLLTWLGDDARLNSIIQLRDHRSNP